MKHIIPAFVLGVALVGGCTDYRSDVFIQGHVGPSTPPCEYSPSSNTTFITGALLEARGQQIVDGKLELTIGLQVTNDTHTPEVANATSQSTSLPNRDDAQVTEADVTVADLTGNTIATENLVASGYVPGQGGQGVVLVDVMGAPVADAIRQKMVFPNPIASSQQMMMTIVLKGTLVSGTAFQTEPFKHELDIDYSDPFAGTPDSTGTYETIAILSDGGISDETVASDGTQTLVNDNNAYADSKLYPLPYPDGGSPLGDGGWAFPTCE